MLLKVMKLKLARPSDISADQHSPTPSQNRITVIQEVGAGRQNRIIRNPTLIHDEGVPAHCIDEDSGFGKQLQKERPVEVEVRTIGTLIWRVILAKKASPGEVGNHRYLDLLMY
jgi:hypothetical protein